MRFGRRWPLAAFVAIPLSFVLARSDAQSATYLPLSDEELARRSPVIVRAQVIAQETRLEEIQGQDTPCTLTTFRVLEVLRGVVTAETFLLELPGGSLGSHSSWIPGTPAFTLESEVLLFLAPVRWKQSDFSLTEFGLSKFDIVTDSIGRRFALRPVFRPGDDDWLSLREAAAPGRSPSLRDANSLVAAVRAFRRTGEFPEVAYAEPRNSFRPPRSGARPSWVNIGGVEGAGTLFRWFWDIGASPSARITIVGTQTLLSDSSDGTAHVGTGVAGWTSVSGTTVNYSLSAGSPVVTVNLDVESHPPQWTAALPCSSGGTIGLGGVSASGPPRVFKGDSNYFANQSGTVWMRRRTGAALCYNFQVFRTGAMHEVGHTLGLGHPDEAQSIHSTTTSADWSSAVMASSVPPGRPFTPQVDDVQAIQWYYGPEGGSPPVANFNFSPASPQAGQTVFFTDTSTNAPTSWLWNFGDPASGAANTSTLQNPTHVFASAASYTVMLTATNSFGSNATSRTVTVSSAGTAPTANFTFNPPNPVAGQPVSFTDTSTGAPTSWLWNFGDPASGGANTSSLPNPTHIFASAGTYTATLTAMNSFGANSTTRTVSVSAGAAGSLSVTLPVAGHVTGVGGLLFLTDVQVENPNSSPVTADLLFFPVGGGASSQVPLTLGPLETRSLPDVVANQFGITNSFGALRLDTSGSPPPGLRMTSRTYDQVGSGTFGMAISGLSETTASAASRFVTGLQRNSAFRTNLGAVNNSADFQTFSVVLRAPGGAIAGTSAPISLPPGGQWQLGLGDLFPPVTGTGLTAQFQSVGGSTVPFAYGTLADNQSGDLTYYPSLRPGSLLYLPVMSRITGVGGALFVSELTVSNISDSPAAVSLTFFERDKDNTTGARLASLSLAPRETRLIDDALSFLFGLSETFGAVKIESTAPVVISERIYTASPTSPGTVGQQVDPIVGDAFSSQASILGLRQDAAFRSNIGLFNPNSLAALIHLTLRRPSGAVLASAFVSVPARGLIQANLTGLFPGVPFPSGELLTIALDAASARVSAYGIIADNVSQDLTASPGLP